jgi:hypothetical protein
MRFFFATLLFLAAAGSAAAADGGAAASGRYTFVKAESGVFRLDTETGEVSLCMDRSGTLVCLKSPGAMGGALASDAHRFSALEARISALEIGGGKAPVPHRDDALGRVRTLAETMMGRVVALVREMKGETASEDL